jgi:endonuclease/exonuclease/phosphatase family metal-dependent hydrolase
MNRRRAILGGASLALSTLASRRRAEGAEAGRSPATLRAMTFNLRYDNPGDGENAWPARKLKAASMFRFHSADVVGVQEALVGQMADLRSALPEYRDFGFGRDDGKEKGELSAIFYRADRFELLDGATFWLSPTPEAVGSRGWDAALPRIATWVRLRDRQAAREIVVLNTHFDHRGEAARRESARLLAARLEAIAGDRLAIVLGDFNCDAASEPYGVLTGLGGLQDSARLSETPHHGPTFSFQGFDFSTRTGPTIDFVFLRNRGTTCVRLHGTLADHWDGRYPSDHFPVLAELELA